MTAVKSYFSSVLRYDDDKMEPRAAREGLEGRRGHDARPCGQDGRARPASALRDPPAGRGAPKIDPKPILDGWKLLEATAIYRAAGKNPFAGAGVTTGQVLLMSKEQLIKRVLVDTGSSSPSATSTTCEVVRSTDGSSRRWST